MSLINTTAKEMHFKILYCGAPSSGKKSSILKLKELLNDTMISFFTLPFKKKLLCLTLRAGTIWDMSAFFHIYNLSNESLEDDKKLFNGTDGLVFIASSEPQDRQKNKESWLAMESLFDSAGKNPFKTPLVLQYNKNDLAKTLPILELRRDLNKYNSKDFPSSAVTGENIIQPFSYVCKLILNQLKI